MTIQVSEHSDGEQIRARVGDTIEIHLAENATTGYSWEADELDAHLLEVQKAASYNSSGAVGSGGDAEFRIKVLKAGSSTIRLKCWRPWEGDRGVLKRFTVKIDAS